MPFSRVVSRSIKLIPSFKRMDESICSTDKNSKEISHFTNIWRRILNILKTHLSHIIMKMKNGLLASCHHYFIFSIGKNPSNRPLLNQYRLTLFQPLQYDYMESSRVRTLGYWVITHKRIPQTYNNYCKWYTSNINFHDYTLICKYKLAWINAL